MFCNIWNVVQFFILQYKMAILDNLKGLFSLEVEGFLENPFKLLNYIPKCAIRACEHKKLVLS